MKWVPARIHWRKPEEGGRSSPPVGTGKDRIYSTVASIRDDNDYWGAEEGHQSFTDGWSLNVRLSGEYDFWGSELVEVAFLSPDAPHQKLEQVDVTFSLFEGSRCVADGSIRPTLNLGYGISGLYRIGFADQDGQDCSIQIGGSGNTSCVWFGVDNCRMRLSQSQLKELMTHLFRFCEAGELDR